MQSPFSSLSTHTMFVLHASLTLRSIFVSTKLVPDHSLRWYAASQRGGLPQYPVPRLCHQNYAGIVTAARLDSFMALNIVVIH